MDEQELYKAMYYRLLGKTCDVIEKAHTLEQAKENLITATRETEEMFINQGE